MPARSVHAARLELKLLLRHGLATLARLEPKVDYVARRYLVEAVPVRPVEKRQTCARCTLYVVVDRPFHERDPIVAAPQRWYCTVRIVEAHGYTC